MITKDNINLGELLKRSEQAGQIIGDTFGDNLFLETQAVAHAISNKKDPTSSLLLLIDGIDTVAVNNIDTRNLTAREATNEQTKKLHELSHAYTALAKSFLNIPQFDSFRRSSSILLDYDEATPRVITDSLRRLTMLPSSGHEYMLSAIHGRAHALKNNYELSLNSHHDLRHLLHHFIGHSHALGYGISDGTLKLDDSEFEIQHHSHHDGARYIILDGEHGATTHISDLNPYSINTN
jgi:hypothetical protein